MSLPITNEANPSERSLMERLSRGELEAFGQLWMIHEPNLRRLCRNFLRNHPEEVEDALGDAMLRSIKALPRSADRIQNIGAWLTVVTTNVCRDVIRKKGRMQFGLDTDRLQTDDQFDPIGSRSENLEERFLERELQQELRTIIQNLPGDLRIPFLLYLSKVPHQAIGDALQITSATSRKRIQRAKTVLQNEFQKLHGERINPVYISPAFLISIDGLFDEIAARPSVKTEIKADFRYHRPVAILDRYGRRVYVNVRFPDKPSLRFRSLITYIARHPNGWKNRFALAQQQYLRGDWREAAKELKRVLDIQPELPRARLLYSEILDGLGYSRHALHQLRRIDQSLLSAPAAFYVEGLLHEHRGDPRRALDRHKAGHNLEPGNPLHAYRISQLALRSGEPDTALEFAETVLNDDPGDLIALACKREALHALDRIPEAFTTNECILELHPGDLPALRFKVDVMIRGKGPSTDGRTLLALLRRLKKFAPDSFLAVEMEIEYLNFRGERRRAREVLRTYLERHPNDAAAREFARTESVERDLVRTRRQPPR